MQKLYSKFIKTDVVSVQNARVLGRVSNLVIRDSDLSIVLLEISPVEPGEAQYLLPQDIRFFNAEKILIDSEDKLSLKEDLVRFSREINNNYALIRKPVVTESRSRLGKVFDFFFDGEFFMVNKLQVRPKGLRSLFITSLLIDKKAIVDTTPKEIVVKDSYAKHKSILPILKQAKKLTPSTPQKGSKIL